MKAQFSTFVRFAVASACLLVVSCGGSLAKLHPVTGKVFYLNEPAGGAMVVFQPLNSGPDSVMPFGTVGPDGTFKLSTRDRGEGAPAGDYVVLITWFPPNSREVDNPRNQLPAKYASPTESPFHVTVKKGRNELEAFQLTK